MQLAGVAYKAHANFILKAESFPVFKYLLNFYT